MYYKIYLDQLFLENLIILVFLLKICSRLCGITMPWIRCFASAAVGAVCTCAVIFFQTGSGWKISGILRVIPLLGSVFMGLRPKGWRQFLGRSACMLVTAGIFAGMFQLIFSIWEAPVLLAAIVVYATLSTLIRFQRERMVLEEYQTEVILEDQGNRWRLTGLIDTGNHLVEPLTGRPVSILDVQMSGEMERFQTMKQESKGWLYIPYHAVGTEKGWMKGIVIDAMYMKYRGEEIRVDRPVLALSGERLSHSEQYQIILNPLQICSR